MHPNFQKVICIGIYLCISICGYSQETYINNRWNWQLGYSKNRSSLFLDETYNTTCFILTKGYGNYFEYGGGFNLLEAKYNSIPYLSLNQKIHILPFFISKPRYRFDMYIPFSFTLYPYKDWDYNKRRIYIAMPKIGIGASAYIIKSWGIFAEFNIEEDIKPYVRFGITHHWYKNKM